MAFMKIGAGDRDRTGDIQLGKLKPTIRLTHNQAVAKGATQLNAALSALIEHDSEHKHALAVPTTDHGRQAEGQKDDLGRRTIWPFLEKQKQKMLHETGG
jgi:hypothetical protein